jgi:two-component system chemotaxis response regulator CheB
LPAALCIVLHLPPDHRSRLPEILSRAGPLPAAHGVDGAPITPGCIYVAPPDHHLLVEAGYIRLTRGPKENRTRPAIDPLFRSAAYAYGPRVIGVVLSGQLDDGTAGLWAVKDRGGIAIVQDPQEAQFPSMPQNALAHVAVDDCLPLATMAATLARLTQEPAPEARGPLVPKQLEIETRIALGHNALDSGVMKLGQLVPYTCPECHGVLVQLQEGGILRFRCHTGHAFSVHSLLGEVTEAVERSLWSTLRAIDESILLMRHLQRHARDQQDDVSAELLEQRVHEAEQRARLIRQTVLNHETLSGAQLNREDESAGRRSVG